MSFRLISSGGSVTDPAAFNLAASGTVRPSDAVDFVRSGTGGAIVTPTTSSSTTTMIFGVSQGYAQGASDTFVPVVLFHNSQIWEVDCANAATTAQAGLRHALSGSDRSVIHNTASDVSTATGIFTAVAMVGSTSGSGKLLGYFNRVHQLIPVNSTTFLQ